MSKQTKLNIGLFGFGVVGESLWQVLQNNTSLNAQISKVCIKHPEKERNAPKELFTANPYEVLSDDSINVLVELIDDANAAYDIVSSALKSGKAVVSANKKMIAEHLPELLALQKEFDAPFLYEAACCASIPVIRNLEEYYDNDLLRSISGIVNGSTNYILTKIAEEGLDFTQALKQAQEKGFAESNPTLDIEGTDALNKLTILLVHAYGVVSHPSELTYTGIHHLEEHDAQYAREKGYEIKLVAHAHKLDNGKIAAFVFPQFLQKDNSLFHVKNEYNGMIIESGLADKQFFNGKGAGGFPTASAVISDLSALRYNYRYEYKKLYNQSPSKLTNDFYLRIYVSTGPDDPIPANFFERIDEWSGNDARTYVVGVVHFSKLVRDTWWKQKGTSVVLLPDAFVTPIVKTQLKNIEELFPV
ncbi:homoserine dehydrogenase [Flavipsychrobacter stenotrophus]|uniref:Homoserine dehydrogenase n=1 Tax=Flavipsychrobacter stenotrophus TaxID=2077091 RepID=A0A2S7SR00_9BACT|nr:homoserine dehydrogenase [Flavipsychrobacter stenotrophus]PQJ09332.1 homoserine dehydrogenase [Flavipsychrobacter stenotrophus]